MAKLNVDTLLKYEDIIEISPLSPNHPVWLVTGDVDSSVVIKTESVGDKSDIGKLKQVIEIMKVVSPMARIKKMENTEIQAVKRWIGFMGLIDDHKDEELAKNLNDLTVALNNTQRTWVKMETVKFISLEDKDDLSAKKIGKALNAPGGLEAMGAIIAADMFNGNADRFDFTHIFTDGQAVGCNWGPKKKKLKYLYNVGNIIVREDGDTATVVGFDPYESSSRMAGLINPLPGDGADWPYQIFHPKHCTNVPLLADQIADDLRRVVGKTTGVITRYRLKKDAGPRLSAGMLNGAKLLENYFKQKYGNGNSVVPTGFAQRAGLAGWNWFQGQTTLDKFSQMKRSIRN